MKGKLGLSIELSGALFLQTGEYKNLLLYEVKEGFGEITGIALVPTPAMEYMVKMDEETRTIVGPLLIPYKKIYRTKGNCYIYFTPESIKYFKSSKKSIQGLKNIHLGHLKKDKP